MATNASERMNMQCIAVHITLESWAPQNKAIGVLADILVMLPEAMVGDMNCQCLTTLLET